MADTARRFEQRTEAVLLDGIKSLDELLMRDGKRLELQMEGYIKSAAEQCRLPV